MPFSRALSGMTLCAVPASSVVIVTTTASVALKRRVTMAWSAITISQATGTGSRVSCGIEAWPPRPSTTISSMSAEASSVPTRLPIAPCGALGMMWSAKAASGSGSSSPSSIMQRAP